MTIREPLLGLSRSELAGLMQSSGEPAYRAQQVAEAIYRQRVESVEEISTLPQQLRARLVEEGVVVGLGRCGI
jgi:23S rRNA (adenine2503-C2)-methyltransferase